jgi:adenine-specific DNA-methyltransferase
MLLLNIISLDYKLKKQNLGYYNQSIAKSQLDNFRKSLDIFIKNINQIANNNQQREESVKLKIRDFLTSTFYHNDQIDIHGNIDLAILNKENSKNNVEVILELKTPQNTAEMISTGNLNKKAMWELVHYYMQERLKGNITIKHLIATNGLEWFIFDAREFEDLFYNNKTFYQNYQNWYNDATVNINVQMAYQIIENHIEKSTNMIEAVHFDINAINTNNDDEIIKLYKLLSPQHLLKLPFANDSNTLNTEFYNELLYILGLEERKEAGKNIISRINTARRQTASLIENTINQLKINKNISDDELSFEIALELCITWLNRILFLKLLEGQLIKFNKNNDIDYSFMNSSRIKDFDDLHELFFEVLALPEVDRSNDVREKYKNIPYLNSSLFELTDYENHYITIDNLKDRLELPLYKYTVLKDNNGKPLTGKLSTLNYLFRFLNSYDFSSDVNKTVQSDNRDIINAAVLGLIFEKINGYKDGSYFTPGYITEYMCRETIRRAIIEKFNDQGWHCRDFTDLYNAITPLNIKEANEIVDSIRICDPAVGSGHFLVSALNEIIAIKSELGILVDETGKILKNCKINVENDELVILYDNEFFQYIPNDPDSQRVQETIFKEKQKIIENCIFGVDINPKSVQITRLRLWIELLKNAYYKAPDYKELETLPNIDINIKCGDSLISRFNLKDDTQNLTPADRKKIRLIINKYKDIVILYKSTTDKDTRHKLRNEIEKLKEGFSEISDPQDPDFKKLKEKQNLLNNLSLQININFDESYVKAWRENLDKLIKEVSELQNIYDEKQKTIYKNAFEWRFEFPEVLNDDGDYVGFDAVIGNPPYIGEKGHKEIFKNVKNVDLGKFYVGKMDYFYFFFHLALNIAKDYGYIAFITTNYYITALGAKKLREDLYKRATIIKLINFNELKIFESATGQHNMITILKKGKKDNELANTIITHKKGHATSEILQKILSGDDNETDYYQMKQKDLYDDDEYYIRLIPKSDESIQKILDKIKNTGTKLGNICNVNQGIVTGADKVSEKHINKYGWKEKKGAGIFVLSDDEVKEFETKRYFKKWYKNSDIKKYYTSVESSQNILYINEKFQEESDIIRHLTRFKENLCERREVHKGSRKWYDLWWGRVQEIFESPKIVAPQRSPRNTFGYNEIPWYASADVYFITQKDENVSLKYILALLNSKLYYLWLYYRGKRKGEFLELYQKPLSEIPIKIVPQMDQQPFIDLVDKILAAKKDNPQADTTAWEKEIDQLVYKLYDLTDEEIAIIENGSI